MVAKTKAEKKRSQEAQAAWIAQQSAAKKAAAPEVAQRWVQWRWSRKLNRAVKLPPYPVFMRHRGWDPRAHGLVLEGSIDEIEQRENCGQRDLFDIRDTA